MPSSKIHTQPAEEKTFDLVIIGGGMAGLCSAVSAARQGVRVALVQDRPVLGGNCSSEIRVVPHGAAHNNAWAAETGLPHEIILEDRAQNYDQFNDHGMINTAFDLLLLEKARREPNLTLYLNTTVRGVLSEALEDPATPQTASNGLGRLGGERRQIKAIQASQMGSEKEFLFRAPQFIDATGDATVGYLAGADFRYGREAREEFGENLAPLVADDVTLGATITMRARDTGHPVAYTPPPWIQKYRTIEEIGYKRTLYGISKPVYGGYWWLEVCNPFHQIRDNAEIRQELHRHVLGVWDFIKNHSDFKKIASTYVLDWIGMIPGKRESRRLMGDVMLSEHNCHEDTDWPDAIAYAGWWIDLHTKGGVLNKVDPGERENVDWNYKHWIRISPFRLPLRAFYSRNVENLWMVGRCLSVSHVALGPSRVMQTLGLMAHAVGIAAAYAVKNQLTPRQTADPAGTHINRIQQAMLRDDVRIIGLRNADSDDLARSAMATASSEATLDMTEMPRDKAWFHLGCNERNQPRQSPGLACVVPVTHDRIECAEFYVKNVTDQEQSVQVELQKLNRIWDRPDLPPLHTVATAIPARFEGWHAVTLNMKVEPGYPYRVALTRGTGIAWAGAEMQPGTVLQYLHICPGGCEPQNAHLPGLQSTEVEIPDYRHWRQLKTGLGLRLSPAPKPFAATNINDGCAWVEDLPHLWISDRSQTLPQHIQLDWPQVMRIGRVEVSFDTNLDRLTQHAEAFSRAPECVSDWRLLVLSGNAWTEVYRESGNFQRKRRAVFPSVITSSLRLEILATNGASEARVYEVRVYEN